MSSNHPPGCIHQSRAWCGVLTGKKIIALNYMRDDWELLRSSSDSSAFGVPTFSVLQAEDLDNFPFAMQSARA